MIDSFGLGTRRVIAVGLAVLLALLFLQWVVVPLTSLIVDMRSDIASLKAREQRLAGAANWPPASADDVPRVQGLLLPADPGRARTVLSSHLAELAQRYDLTAAPPVVTVEGEGAEAIYVATWSVAGIHDNVLRLIADSESGRPLLRMRSLSLEPVLSGAGDLSAELVLEARGSGQ